MRGKKTLFFIILGLIIIGAIGAGLWYFLRDGDFSLPNFNDDKEQHTVIIPPKETEEIDSHLFRDDIIGQTKDVINETETIEENLLGYNWETNYVYNANNILIGFISTLVPDKGEEFDYARTHQIISSAIMDDTGTIPDSVSEWSDGKDYDYSTTMWNKGLSNGSLTLQDAFSTHQGEVVLVTESDLLDSSLSRPASEKTFITLLVGPQEFINMYIH